MPKTEAWEDILYDDLQNDEYVAAYLSEALQDPDPHLFLQMIKRVAHARKISMVELARRSNLTRPAVYHALSEKGNPQYSTLIALMSALGFHFAAVAQQRA